MKSVLLIALLFSWALAQAEVPIHAFTERENAAMAEANAQTAQTEGALLNLFSNDDLAIVNQLQKVRAYAEYDEAGYLVFSSNYAFSSRQAKLTMAKHLPPGVQLVVYTESTSEAHAARIKKEFSRVIDPGRVTVVYMPNAWGGFWARDGVPVPVFRQSLTNLSEENFTVVDARYPRFEQDRRFSQLFESDMTRYNYYFEGGNFITNSKNECLIVNKTATAQIPDSIFKDHYGCHVLVRLPHVKGIGHADESVKFIDDHTVLTDEPSYIPILEARGYDVIQLPRPQNDYETYVNSLPINGTMYVPIFHQKNDEAALQVYRDAGFDPVIGIDSRRLSNEGLGSLHCITMTYPPVPISELLHNMGGSVIAP